MVKIKRMILIGKLRKLVFNFNFHSIDMSVDKMQQVLWIDMAQIDEIEVKCTKLKRKVITAAMEKVSQHTKQ